MSLEGYVNTEHEGIATAVRVFYFGEDNQNSVAYQVGKEKMSESLLEERLEAGEYEELIRRSDHEDAKARQRAEGIKSGKKGAQEAYKILIEQRLEELRETEAETKGQHNVRAAKINELEGLLEQVSSDEFADRGDES